MVLIALFVALGFVATGVLPVQQYLERGSQVTEAQARLDALVERNRNLEESAEGLLTDSEIERVAREQYGFVREGEVGYVVVTPDGEDLAAASPEPATIAEPDTRGFFQRVIDYITGRDTTNDG
jgi:cell division protein FtsB